MNQSVLVFLDSLIFVLSPFAIHPSSSTSSAHPSSARSEHSIPITPGADKSSRSPYQNSSATFRLFLLVLPFTRNIGFRTSTCSSPHPHAHIAPSIVGFHSFWRLLPHVSSSLQLHDFYGGGCGHLLYHSKLHDTPSLNS